MTQFKKDDLILKRNPFLMALWFVRNWCVTAKVSYKMARDLFVLYFGWKFSLERYKCTVKATSKIRKYEYYL